MSIRQEYKDVLLFAVCLFAANGVWKLMIQGDEGTNEVMWLGLNVTPLFRALSDHIARVVFALTHVFRDSAHFHEPSTIAFDSGFAYTVVWSCTAVKQSFIWLVIMLFVRGSWKRKLWFIPLGWLVAYVFNILRITAIGLLCEHHPDLFGLYHLFIFKYLFYAILFALWVWWIEHLSSPKTA